MKLNYRNIIVAIAMAFLAGCVQWNPEEAPFGFAVIREHVISAPGNDPPVGSTLDFTLIEIDGMPVTRETLPRLVDMQPGVLLSAGSHKLKARVAPHLRPPGHKSEEVVFTATVESTSVYYLVDKDSEPILIKVRSKRR